MQICYVLAKVVFVLSTIVLVTDCCSSRVLLLKDRTARIMENASSQLPINDDSYDSNVENETEIFQSSSFDEGSTILNITEKSLLDPGSTYSLIPPQSNANEFRTDASIRSQQAGNPNYHVIDIYYTIMRDVLSFECTGQFLTDFCLNNGRCFRYPIGNHSFFSCECADGYVGERCESKSLNEVFIPIDTSSVNPSTSAPKILTARVVFSFPMLIALSAIYLLIAGMVVFRCPCKD